MHIEASWYVKGSVAILEGPYTMPTTNCKMTFYYHMFGGDCGSLLVYINSGEEVQLVFNKTGPQGQNWLKADVQLKSDYAFRVHITATRGNSYKGDIAIDDISFQVTPDQRSTEYANYSTVVCFGSSLLSRFIKIISISVC